MFTITTPPQDTLLLEWDAWDRLPKSESPQHNVSAGRLISITETPRESTGGLAFDCAAKGFPAACIVSRDLYILSGEELYAAARWRMKARSIPCLVKDILKNEAQGMQIVGDRQALMALPDADVTDLRRFFAE
jgi:hypothetical protein